MVSSRSASARSCSFMIPPRAQLMIRQVGFIFLKCSARIMLSVSGVLGAWTVMKSDRSMSSSTETSSTPRASAFIWVRIGSNVITFMPKDCARLAISPPMRPMPMIPRTFSKTSVPMNFFRSQRPASMDAWAAGIFRHSAKRSAKACSQVEIVLPPGVFMTTIPAFVAAVLSILSVPTPALPITFSFLAA